MSTPVDAPTLDYQTPSAPRRTWPRIVAWTLGGLAALALGASILAPSLNSPRPTSNRAKCASNLHQIGLAILLYQQDYGGQYPDTLGRLTEAEQIGPDTFVCPQSNDERSTGPTTRAISDDVTAGPAGHHCSYLYVGSGLTDKTTTPTTVVAYDAPDNHDGDGGNVLYGDGHVDWLTKADMVKALPPVTTTRPAP